MPNLIVTTSFGSVEVPYSTRDELEQILKTLPDDIEFIEQSIGQVQPNAQRIVKSGFESAYRFVNGKVELLVSSLSAIEKVALTLYAYYPDMTFDKDIKATTGIEDFKAKVVGQTLNKQYFRIDGDKYGLSDSGLSYIQEKIKPKFQGT